ncbi:hypothetical protein IWQ56_004016 [Coemansia nantahalensis]|nr:hypothetical protein IWQ56_004016 [Coemansia nantahalensis]
MNRHGLGLGTLPEDIVILVMRAAARLDGALNECWKQKLALLAVCRQWRRLALPLVAREVYFMYGSRSDFVRPLAAVSTSAVRVRDEDRTGPLSSNADILGSDAYAQVKKSLWVRVFFGSDPLPALAAMLRTVQGARARWASVQSLTFNMSPQARGARDNLPDPDIPHEQIARFAQQFAEAFPGIRELRIDAPYRNEISRLLYARLTDAYSSQLAKVVCLPPIPCSSICFSNQLTCLEIGPFVDGRLPRAVAGSLVSLTLYTLDASYDWSSFAADGSTGQQPIVFANLKRLWVFFESDRGGSGSSRSMASMPRVEFPVLERLCFGDVCGSARFLETARLPRRMGSLRVRGTYSTFQRLWATTLPRLDNLSLSMTSGGGGKPAEVLGTLSQIIARAKPQFGAAVEIEDREVAVDPAHIAGVQLADLQVAAPTSAETLLAVLGGQPRIRSLSLANFAPGQVPAVVPVAELAAGGAVELAPFATQLESLYIEFRPSLHPAESVLAVAQYVMLRTPSLRRVELRSLPGRSFDAFLQQYRAAYPHLASILVK